MKRLEPHMLDTTGAEGGEVVGFNPTTGDAEWLPGTLLIESSASAPPAGTAAGTIIFKKA